MLHRFPLINKPLEALLHSTVLWRWFYSINTISSAFRVWCKMSYWQSVVVWWNEKMALLLFSPRSFFAPLHRRNPPNWLPWRCKGRCEKAPTTTTGCHEWQAIMDWELTFRRSSQGKKKEMHIKIKTWHRSNDRSVETLFFLSWWGTYPPRGPRFGILGSISVAALWGWAHASAS